MKTLNEKMQIFDECNKHLWNAIIELNKASRTLIDNKAAEDDDLHNLFMEIAEYNLKLHELEEKYFNKFILNK